MYSDYFGSEHVFTHKLFYKLKTSCWLPEKLESLSLENWIQTGKRTIARIIYNSNRSRKFNQRFVFEKSIACLREEKIFKNEFDSIFVKAPCCLHPIHKRCVNQFTKSRGRDKLCKKYGTDHSELIGRCRTFAEDFDVKD